MKANAILVGHVYSVKLDGRCQPVLITGKKKGGGWTGEIVGLKKPKPVTIADPKMVRAHSDTLTKRFGMAAAKAQAADAEAKAKTKKATRTPGGRRGGILDAAATILAKAKTPMHTKAIVEAALKQGLWQTKGKTPEATLYSAITREIANKGKDSRFKKVGPGSFSSA